MASTQVVETSVTNNSPSQNSYHPDDLFQSRYATAGFKPFSYLILYHLKNVLQGDLDVLVNRAEFIIFMQSRVPLGPGKFHVVVLVGLIMVPRETGNNACTKFGRAKQRVLWYF